MYGYDYISEENNPSKASTWRQAVNKYWPSTVIVGMIGAMIALLSLHISALASSILGLLVVFMLAYKLFSYLKGAQKETQPSLVGEHLPETPSLPEQLMASLKKVFSSRTPAGSYVAPDDDHPTLGL